VTILAQLALFDVSTVISIEPQTAGLEPVTLNPSIAMRTVLWHPLHGQCSARSRTLPDVQRRGHQPTRVWCWRHLDTHRRRYRTRPPRRCRTDCL